MKTIRKPLGAVLAAAIIFFVGISVSLSFADTNAGDTTLDFTVTESINATASSNSTELTYEDYTIKNNASRGIVDVTKITTKAADGWQLLSNTEDFTTISANDKSFSMVTGEHDMISALEGLGELLAGGEKTISFFGQTGIAVNEIKNEKMADVVVTVSHIPEYEVSFDANGGTTAATGVTTIRADQKFGELPTAENGIYIFLGWYTEKAGGEKITADSYPNGDITYYAHWEHPCAEDGHTEPNADGQCNVCSQTLKVVDGLGDIGVENADGAEFEYNPEDGSLNVVVPPADEETETPSEDIPQEELPALIDFEGGKFRSSTSYTPGEYETIEYETVHTRTIYPVPKANVYYSKWQVTEDKTYIPQDLTLEDLPNVMYGITLSEYIAYNFETEKDAIVEGVTGKTAECLSIINKDDDTEANIIYLAAYTNKVEGHNNFHIAKWDGEKYVACDLDEEIAKVNKFTETYTTIHTEQVMVKEPSSTTEYVYIPTGDFKAEKGMTWRQWIESEYNTTEREIISIKDTDYNDVDLDSVIEEGESYAFITDGLDSISVKIKEGIKEAALGSELTDDMFEVTGIWGNGDERLLVNESYPVVSSPNYPEACNVSTDKVEKTIAGAHSIKLIFSEDSNISSTKIDGNPRPDSLYIYNAEDSAHQEMFNGTFNGPAIKNATVIVPGDTVIFDFANATGKAKFSATLIPLDEEGNEIPPRKEYEFGIKEKIKYELTSPNYPTAYTTETFALEKTIEGASRIKVILNGGISWGVVEDRPYTDYLYAYDQAGNLVWESDDYGSYNYPQIDGAEFIVEGDTVEIKNHGISSNCTSFYNDFGGFTVTLIPLDENGEEIVEYKIDWEDKTAPDTEGDFEVVFRPLQDAFDEDVSGIEGKLSLRTLEILTYDTYKDKENTYNTYIIPNGLTWAEFIDIYNDPYIISSNEFIAWGSAVYYQVYYDKEETKTVKTNQIIDAYKYYATYSSQGYAGQ